MTWWHSNLSGGALAPYRSRPPTCQCAGLRGLRPASPTPVLALRLALGLRAGGGILLGGPFVLRPSLRPHAHKSPVTMKPSEGELAQVGPLVFGVLIQE